MQPDVDAVADVRLRPRETVAVAGKLSPTENRGRVTMQDTGMPIAGALVVGKYMGSIAWAGASCDRVESAVSDQEGWFTIPTDSTGKPPFKGGLTAGVTGVVSAAVAIPSAPGESDRER